MLQVYYTLSRPEQPASAGSQRFDGPQTLVDWLRNQCVDYVVTITLVEEI